MAQIYQRLSSQNLNQSIEMRSGDMLTRSKIKMEESIRHVHGEELPYFNNDEASNPSYIFKQNRENHSQQSHKQSQSKISDNPSKYVGYRTELSEVAVVGNQGAKNTLTRNDILKELRQEYQILRNLNVDESIHMNIKKYENEPPRFSEGSEYSSSKNSKKDESEVHPVKQSSREVQTLHLEKKQLEVVISNSMRKIEELLNAQISLKKTIHELKNQLEGKGGVHQQYEKTIRGFQKNEQELTTEMERIKHDNDKLAQKVKDMSEKIRSLQNELSGKDKEIKQGFDEQRQLHELIRIEKDKHLHLEIQCKSLKMEYELLQKDKNNEISRMNKQLLAKQGNGKNEKEMAYVMRKLQDEIKEKDKRMKELVQQLVELKEKGEPIQKKNDKSILEELMYKSRQMNDYNNKALTDSVNLIFVKMTEIEKKNDQNLKKEIEALKRKTDQNKRNINQNDLLTRIKELEKMIEKEVGEKNRLLDDIKLLKQHKYDLEDKARRLEKKMAELQEEEQDLKQEIEELEVIKKNYLAASAQKTTKDVEPERDDRSYLQTLTTTFKEKEKRLEDDIRALKRRVDEAEFETEKARKQGEFNLGLLKTQHEGQTKRMRQESARLLQKLQSIDADIAKLRSDYDGRLLLKDNEIASLKPQVDSLKKQHQQDLNHQKSYYEQRIAAERHSAGLKGASGANDKMMTLEGEVGELRRALKQSRTTNAGLDHLWGIKQAEYGNINDILQTLRT